MITNFYYQKTVDKLGERMKEIKRSYNRAFLYGFIGGLLLVVSQVMYYYIRLMMMSLAYVEETAGDFERPHEWTVFLPDVILLIASIICVVFSFLSFKQKFRVIKIIFFIFTCAFFVLCIVLMCLGLDKDSYLVAMFYTAGLIAVTIDCFLKDKDDMMLSQIEGYPNFDPLLMQDMKPDESVERPKLRFNDRGAEGYVKLGEERDREYIENNPNSETAIAFRKKQEEEREQEIADWLDSMLK